jgi:sugar phosphate isomerase/epimerase
MLLLASQSFPRYGLERFFQFAKTLGFKSVEIQLSSNFDTQNPKYLHELEERFGIKITILSLPATGADEFIEAFERVAAEFPGVMINVFSPEVFSSRYKAWMQKSLPQLCQRYRLRMNRVTAPFKTVLGVMPTRTEGSMHALREAGEVSVDLIALWKSNEDIMRAPGFLREKMRHIYLSNAQGGQGYTSLPHGVLPVESFLTKLAREDYRGDFTLKIAPQHMHEGNDDRMLAVLKESKEFFEKYFKAE